MKNIFIPLSLPNFSSLICQKTAINFLANIISNQSVPNALLFTGIKGCGKYAGSMLMCLSYNCDNKFSLNEVIENSSQKLLSSELIKLECDHDKKIWPCGICNSCKKIISEKHPDIICIKPLKLNIKIEQIRDLYHILSTKPYEAKNRFVLILEAHSMTIEASNALLKILEEPPEKTAFILNSFKTSNLLQTIISRCQRIRFAPLPAYKIEEILIKQYNADKQTASIISGLSNGSLSKAKILLNNKGQKDLAKQRQWVIEEFNQLSQRPMAYLLAFADKISDNRQSFIEMLEILMTYIRDLIIYKYCPDKIINKDFIQKIRYFSENISVKSLISKIEDIQSAQKNVNSNSSLKLTAELLIIKIAK